MLANDNPHSERFQALLGELKAEVDSLKGRIQTLQQEKSRLEHEISDMKAQEADIFSSVKETDRMALKHQIKGLISKIDEHLEES